MSSDAIRLPRLYSPPRIADVPVDSVPLLDIPRELGELRGEIDAAIACVMDSHQFVLGPEAQALEGEIAARCQVSDGICCASGSDALLLALMALDVGPGDEVVLPSFTFFATAAAVWRLGAKPVFADIEPTSFNICPAALRQAITEHTKVVIPVHLFGQCAEMGTICQIAAEHDVRVVEDAAQALLSHHAGRPGGAWGDIGCFSFYPTKNLGACGDAGMMVTNDAALAEKLRLLRVHGMSPRYYHKVVGINSRLDAIQAAILRVKLKYLDEWTAKRQHNAAQYEVMFVASGLDQLVTLPSAFNPVEHVWNQYTIRVPGGRRDELRAFLKQSNIGAEIYYPVPLHQQECFVELLGSQRPLPATDLAANEVLSLPVFPGLSEEEQLFVVNHIADFFGVCRVYARLACAALIWRCFTSEKPRF